MKIVVDQKLDAKTEILVVGLWEGQDGYHSFNKELAKDLDDAVKEKMFSPKFGEVYSTKISSLPYKRVFVLGLGKKEEMTMERVRRALGRAVKCTKPSFSSFTTNVLEMCYGTASVELLGRAAAESLLLADYNFVKYLAKEKQEKKKPLAVVSLQWTKQSLTEGLHVGRVIAEATNFVRDLVNEPANVVTSEFMEKVTAKVVSSHSKLKMKVLNKAEMEKLGMGALLGVNAGSYNPPKLVVVEYNGTGKEKPIAFVGKGITFDSGGYNLKPTKYIEDMKTDMAGAAAVLGTLKAAAELGLSQNLLGVMPFCENMVSSMAQRPGDIVRAYNGKTIEIGNTDAEGRLILADALAYAEDKYEPQVMIDLATLTGACVVAFGYYAAGIVSKNENLIASLKEAGETSGDRLWPFPFYEDYLDWMEGSISDLNNISTKGKGYEAGSITAGAFLAQFVKKARWAHLDIAGSSYWSVDGDYLQKGATGSGVRALMYYLLQK